MATVVTTLKAERWLDEILIEGGVANATGVQANDFSLPVGIGDVAIMSVDYRITGITTLPTITNLGVLMTVVSQPSGQPVDIIGSAPFRQVYEGAAAIIVAAYLDPDALVLWRYGEYVQCATPIMDSGNTGDIAVRFKCVRIRPVESAPMPLQLVR